MQIRHAMEADVPQMMKIYEHARQFMADHGNPKQWGATNWPPEALIYDDIQNGTSYVCESDDGRVIGCFFYNNGHDVEPTYRNIEDGDWIGDNNYGVVHRIASSGEVKGIGEFMLSWALKESPHLRMDTHGDNTVMQNFLTKMGFKYCGIIYVEEDDDPRLAYEKLDT